jgi:AAA domain
MTTHVKPSDLAGSTAIGSLFREAENTSAFFKAGITGFAGTGKSKTAAIIARGLVKLARELRLPYADKPVFYYDTETGSDFLRKDFAADGIPLRTLKSRAFVDMLAAVHDAQANGSVLICDSVTHPWQELCETFRRSKAERLRQPTYKLQFQDWAYLKAEWAKFTTAFVNSPLHILICGRAAFEYDFFEDDDGKKQLEKTDVKMAAEKDAGYEPSILLYMERHRDMETMKAYRTATILKDRADVIDGQIFRDPTFENFMPHVQCLNLGGQQLGVDTTRTSARLIPKKDERDDNARKRRIILDEIETLMTLHFPGQTAKDKTAKLSAMLKHFSACWTEMEEIMPLFDLRCGYETLHQELTGGPSKYASTPITQKVELAHDIKDGIPDFLKRELPDAPKPNGQTTDPAWVEEFVS